MDNLRWILLLIGVAIIAVVYVFTRFEIWQKLANLPKLFQLEKSPYSEQRVRHEPAAFEDAHHPVEEEHNFEFTIPDIHDESPRLHAEPTLDTHDEDDAPPAGLAYPYLGDVAELDHDTASQQRESEYASSASQAPHDPFEVEDRAEPQALEEEQGEEESLQQEPLEQEALEQEAWVSEEVEPEEVEQERVAPKKSEQVPPAFAAKEAAAPEIDYAHLEDNPDVEDIQLDQILAEELEPTVREEPPEPLVASVDVEPLVLVLTVMAAQGSRIPGLALLAALEAEGLRYGEMQIFHYFHGNKTPPVFGLVNVVEPGVFDPATMDEFSTPGVTLFCQLPGVMPPRDAFERMLSCARNLADRLQARLCDDRRNALSNQALSHYRDQISAFERKLMLAQKNIARKR